MSEDIEDKVINNLGVYNGFHYEGQIVRLAFVLRARDRRPLNAAWWTGKQCYLIAGDVYGNFFLRHSDGSVRYWVHHTQSECRVANSVKDFLTQIKQA